MINTDPSSVLQCVNLLLIVAPSASALAEPRYFCKHLFKLLKTMKFIVILSLFSLSSSMRAQSGPVQWSYEAKKVTESEYDLLFTAEVDKGWFIYSQYLESDEGPIATSFDFQEDSNVELVGEIKEDGHKKEGFDEIFGMNLIKFSGKVKFTQRIKLKGKTSEVVGSLEFMTCDDERCLPPTTIDFTIPLK